MRRLRPQALRSPLTGRGKSLVRALGVAALTLALMAPATAKSPINLDVETYTLPNGLTVILNHDSRLPQVAVEVRYLVGSAHERKGRSGFAHLFEHLMFQGSKNHDKEYFEPFEPIGAKVNGTTNTDRTNYYEQVPSNYLELCLWMESDRMANLLPALTQAKLDNQRDVVKNERRQRYENTPYGLVWKFMHNHMYPEGHPYQHTTIGSHADLTAATLDDVKNFFSQYYAPKNAVLTIVGDFDRDKAKALIVQYFGSLAPGKRAPVPTAAMPKFSEAPQMVIDVDKKVKLPRIHFMWHTPALYKAGDAEMDLLAGVLSEGKTSRLYKPLVYEQKVAKDVQAFQVSRGMSSVFVVQATAAPGKSVDELHAAMLSAVKEALKTPPSADELDRVMNGYKKNFFQRFESNLSRATLLSTYYALAGTPDYFARDLQRYTDLTPSKVHEHTKRWLADTPHLRIDILPEPALPSAPAPAPTPAPAPGQPAPTTPSLGGN